MVKAREMPPTGLLREYFKYDPVKGALVRRKSTSNNNKSGDVVGSRQPNGYLKVVFFGHTLSVHRLAFKIMTGKEPKGLIDHKNGIKCDNRWENLRDVTPSQNSLNRVAKGWCKIPNGRYRSYIGVEGNVYDIGYHNCQTAAHLSYLQEKKRLGLLYVV